MALLLLRHATAGHRRPGAEEAEDRLRPLDDQGRRQADALPALYAGLGVERLVTSPYVRCRESVVPLSRALGLPVEERAELAEGARDAEVWDLVAELASATAVLCTHGDILGVLLGEEPEKGSTWIVEADANGGLSRREYLPPPA
jgi:phosphohistidine phosphatase SixA